jgi:asparagine N-glycosylation enzyme membrane subunit Stt3
MDGPPTSFRKWSILAFAAESVIVILTFLFMIFFLKWEINATMMYLLLLVMVLSAVLLLMTGRTTVEK